MLRAKPLFPGHSELDQLASIFTILGTPTEAMWPEFLNLPVCGKVNFTVHPPSNWRGALFPQTTDLEYDLLSRCLVFNPQKRITATEAVSHPYFTEYPLPAKYDFDEEDEKRKKRRENKDRSSSPAKHNSSSGNNSYSFPTFNL